MARRGGWSLLRRTGAPVGGALLLGAVLAASAAAATPSPDPPPEAVAPEPPPVTRSQPPRRCGRRRSRAPTPVVPQRACARASRRPCRRRRSRSRSRSRAKRPVATKPQVAAQPQRAQPHDRGPVPLATLVAVDELPDRGLLVLGGVALAARGRRRRGRPRRRAAPAPARGASGCSLLARARRERRRVAGGIGTVTGTAGANGWYTQQRHDQLDGRRQTATSSSLDVPAGRPDLGRGDERRVSARRSSRGARSSVRRARS